MRGHTGFFDVKLAEALDDRASFRQFCGFTYRVSEPFSIRRAIWGAL